MFTALCGFMFRDSNNWGFIFSFEPTRKELKKVHSGFDFIRHFTSIGLIPTEPALHKPSTMNGTMLDFFGKKFILVAENLMDSGKKPRLEKSCIVRFLTQIGQELFNISGAHPLSDYPMRVNEFLKKDLNVELQEAPK